MAEATNPFAQFLAPPEEPKVAAEGPNPFAQFVPGADVAAPVTAPKGEAKPLSPVRFMTEEGFPIFESEEDNRAARRAVADLFKSIPGGLVRGLRDIPDAGAQLLTRGLEAVSPAGSDLEKFAKGERERVEGINRNAEQDYQENWRNPEVPDVGRFVGNAVGAAPIAAATPGIAAASLPVRMMAGGAAGGASGALQPVDTEKTPDFWSQKALQTGAGAAGGTVAPVVAGGLARMVSPATRPEVTTLMNAGVTPTPGQILGGSANRIEEAAQSIPLIGDAIRAARGRTVEDLNRAAINRSLEPIGEALPANTPLGREAISEMHQRLSDNYNRLVPQLGVQIDRDFVTHGLADVNNLRARMSDPAQQQLNRILQHDVLNKFDQQGRMTGEQFKTVESELGRQARSFGNSAVASERQIGDALGRLQQHFRDLLVRNNPAHAAELRAANEGFAHGLRVEGAAAKPGGDMGVFTPAQLLQSVRQLDPSLRKGAYARGDALMQELADAGKSVLGNKVPDSGTPLRGAVMAAGGLGPLYMYNPAAAIGTAGVGAGVLGAYSRPGVNTLAALLARRPQGAEQVADLLRSPRMSPLAALIAEREFAH